MGAATRLLALGLLAAVAAACGAGDRLHGDTGIGAASGAPSETPLELEVDAGPYGPGEPIVIRLMNRSASALLVPAGAASCSTVVVERDEEGSWVPLAACPSPTFLVRLESGAGFSVPIARAARGDGVIAAAPDRLDLDLRALPVSTQAAAGDGPMRATEVPIGVLPSGHPPSTLPPGRYRFVVPYLAEGEERGLSAVSIPFVVAGG